MRSEVSMRLSRTEVAALAFGACSVALAFPIAWESHLMNRCISTLQQELRDNQPKKNAAEVDYFIQAVSACNGS